MSTDDSTPRGQGESGSYYGTGVYYRNSGKHHNTAFFVLVTALLISFLGAYITRNYDISLTRSTEGAFSLLILPHTDNNSAELLQTTADTSSELEDAEKSSVSDNAAYIGTGTTLSITESKQEAGIEETSADAVDEVKDSTDKLSLQEIYQKNIVSVVSITACSSNSVQSGTGIIMSEDGYIITNAHVIDGCTEYEVLLSDDTEYEAVVVGSDSFCDLAVLKIDAYGLTPAEFGDSDNVEVGDSVAAIGDPLGQELRGTMTDGIISAINRNITTNGRTMTLLQTNAQLNNGNSGGPLINDRGQVIGINTLKFGSYYSTSIEGIGFAIPIESAKTVIDELIEYGYVTGRPVIGYNGYEVPLYAQRYYRLPDGIYVSEVIPRTGAESAGLQEGDIIVSAEGTAVTTPTELQTVLLNKQVGSTIVLKIYRSGSILDIEIVLTDQNGQNIY